MIKTMLHALKNLLFKETPWERTHIKNVELPCLNLNHTYQRKNGIKFTKQNKEIIVIMELSPENGGYSEDWIIAEKIDNKYDCYFQTSDVYTNQFLKEKFNITNNSFIELFNR